MTREIMTTVFALVALWLGTYLIQREQRYTASSGKTLLHDTSIGTIIRDLGIVMAVSMAVTIVYEFITAFSVTPISRTRYETELAILNLAAVVVTYLIIGMHITVHRWQHLTGIAVGGWVYGFANIVGGYVTLGEAILTAMVIAFVVCLAVGLLPVSLNQTKARETS